MDKDGTNRKSNVWKRIDELLAIAVIRSTMLNAIIEILLRCGHTMQNITEITVPLRYDVYAKELKKQNSDAFKRKKFVFRQLTNKDLVAFYKMIKEDNYTGIKTLIWGNPYYLIGEKSTLRALKLKWRYNPLHVCCARKKTRIAELILETVSDPKFVYLLTRNNNEKVCTELGVHLLDCYLNNSETRHNDTPLHLAARYGALEIVQLLMSHPQCKMFPNSQGLLPIDIVCSDAPKSSIEVRKKIELLLENTFYVPVLRSIDNVIPPIIGEPFQAKYPPNLNPDPFSPKVEIKALAGPMSLEKAKQFCRRWKIPPRIGSDTSSLLTYSPFISPKKLHIMDKTYTKSDDPASPKIMENRSSHSDGATMGTKDISKAVATALQARPKNPSFKERHIKIMDAEKGVELIGRELAKQQQVHWREYWDFIDKFIDIASDQGIEQLENYFTELVNKKSASNDYALENEDFYNEFPQFSAHMCVESYLKIQVKRMTEAIVQNLNNLMCIKNTLSYELSIIRSLILSYKEDPRFSKVNFTKIHSRIGSLMALNLQRSLPHVKVKTQLIVKHLVASGEWREQTECVCRRIIQMVEFQIYQVPPENLRTEAICARTWDKEHDCNCLWETNVSSLEQRSMPQSSQENTALEITNTTENIVTVEAPSDNEQSNTSYKTSKNLVDNFAFDEPANELHCSEENNSLDSDETGVTMLASPAKGTEIDKFEDFIFGKIPTKRDVDVLNAIRHIDLDMTKYPRTYSWKRAMLRFSREEIEAFLPHTTPSKQASEKIVQCDDHSPVACTSKKSRSLQSIFSRQFLSLKGTLSHWRITNWKIDI